MIMADRSYLERLHLELIEQGRVIEAGWVALRLSFIPLDAGAHQLDEMKKAYMAGAQHMWATIHAASSDVGDEPTEADMRRMDNIAAEMQAYGDKLMADLPTQGRG
jgi:hypothetical protein